MIKFVLCCAVITASFCAVMAMGDNMLGPGRWFVRSIQQCDNHEQYEFKFFIQRKKMTRDKDCYNANITLERTIDDTFGIRMDMCKYVDGGCKQYQVLSDDSFIGFVEKYAKDNMEKALTMAGVDPPEMKSMGCGSYGIENYEFDYCQLPTDAVYGEFRVEAYLIEDNKEVGCVSFNVDFVELDGACDGDDEEE